MSTTRRRWRTPRALLTSHGFAVILAALAAVATSPPAGAQIMLALNDDFDDGTLATWWTVEQGSWSESGGTLDSGYNLGSPDEMILTDQEWTGGKVIRARIRNTPQGAPCGRAMIVFSYSNPDDYYYADLYTWAGWGPQCSGGIYRWLNGSRTRISDTAPHLQPDSWYRVRVTVSSGHVRFEVADDLDSIIFTRTADDPGIGAGRIGFGNSQLTAGGGVEVDWVTLTPLTLALFDDFDDASVGPWWNVGSGDWSESGTSLDSGYDLGSPNEHLVSAVAFNPNSVVTARLRNTPQGAPCGRAMIVFSYSNPDDYYYADLYTWAGWGPQCTGGIYRWLNGSRTRISAPAPSYLMPDDWYLVTVTTSPGEVTFEVIDDLLNPEYVLTASDPGIGAGQIGFGNSQLSAGGGVEVDFVGVSTEILGSTIFADGFESGGMGSWSTSSN